MIRPPFYVFLPQGLGGAAIPRVATHGMTFSTCLKTVVPEGLNNELCFFAVLYYAKPMPIPGYCL
jgi:hypothetical protein